MGRNVKLAKKLSYNFHLFKQHGQTSTMAKIFKIAFLLVFIGASLAKKAGKRTARNNFNLINTNGDRFIDLAEVEAALSDRDDLKDQNAADLIAQMDGNDDGRLTFKEFWRVVESDESNELLADAADKEEEELVGKQARRFPWCIKSCPWWNLACAPFNNTTGCSFG